MKNIFKLTKEEKVVLVVGILIMVLIVAGGTLKSKYGKTVTYIPKDISRIETANAMTLKKDIFKVAIDTKLSQDVGHYIQASSDDLAHMKLDLSKVKMSVLGKYPASAILGDTKLPFTVEVVQDIRPIFTLIHPNFQFVITNSSNIEEVIEYAGVSAKDRNNHDISKDITGWPDQLPKKSTIVTYTLTVKDKDGNAAKQKVQVQYIDQRG